MGSFDCDDLRGLGRGPTQRGYPGYGQTQRPRLMQIGTAPAATYAPPLTQGPSVNPYATKSAAPQFTTTTASPDVVTQLAKCRASEAALIKVIQTAQQQPAPGVAPTGLQSAFMQVRAQLAKCRASEAALTKVIQTAQQPPAPGVAPSGLQNAFGQARARIAKLEAQVRQLGGTP